MNGSSVRAGPDAIRPRATRERASRTSWRTLAAVLLLAVASPVSALSPSDDSRDTARRRAGPFDAALRRLQSPQPAASRAHVAVAPPWALLERSARTPAAAARPPVVLAGLQAPVTLADAALPGAASPDPLDELLRAHQVELAERDGPADSSALAASAEPMRLAALDAAVDPGATPRPRTRTAAATPAATTAAGPGAPTAVRIPGEGRRTVAAHLFAPTGPGPFPAIVMLPGETGAHAGTGAARCIDAGAQAEGQCSARTLAQRYLAWGRWWASQGVVAVLVDAGRSTAVDAQRVARWLRERPGVDGARVALQGWGRSGRTVVATALQPPAPGTDRPAFRAGLALYPDCVASDGQPPARAGLGPSDAPRAAFELLVMLAAREGEAVVERCTAWLEPSARAGGSIEVVVFDDAGRGFDDPAARLPPPAGRGDWRANRWAMQDAMRRAAAFVARRMPADGATSGTTAGDRRD